MKAKIQRRGNSLVIRIPQSLAEAAGLQPDDELEITLRGGEIVLTPNKTRAYSLDELIEGVTPENRPEEWEMGSAAGKEGW